MKEWTAKETRLLKKHYPAIPEPRDLVKIIGRTYSSIRTKAVKMSLKRAYTPWPTAKERKLIKLYPNMKNVDIAKILNTTESSIMAKAYKLRLFKSPQFKYNCSSRGFFQKGQEPANKGKRMEDYLPKATIRKIKKTQFKKGNKPQTYLPIGTQRTAKDGYIEIKVKDPNKWAPKQRVIWEQANGKVPAGKFVKFRDGNKLNFSLDNLYLSDRVENMKANTYHNWPKEIADAVQLRGALNRQINKHLRNEKH